MRKSDPMEVGVNYPKTGVGNDHIQTTKGLLCRCT